MFSKSKGCTAISPEEARERLRRDPGTLLLDVRTPEEYAQLHIPNSISLPLAELKSGISQTAPDKATPLIVYCQSGMRASEACRQLAAMGYADVRNMGGIVSWKYETTGGKKR